MALKTMYPFANSLLTNLAEAISASDASVKVDDIAFFPEAPNFATIGSDNTAEVISYSGIDTVGSRLIGCVRGQCGTAAKPWDSGLDIYHAFTRDNGNNMIDNIAHVDKRITGANLLINGELSAWQRGDSFTNPNGAYTADRMMNTGGTIKKNPRGWGMDIVGTTVLKYLAEDIDWKPIEGRAATLSYSKDGIIVAEAKTITDRQFVELSLSDCALDWIKLELGEVATTFVPRPVAEVMNKCMRYYEVINQVSTWCTITDRAYSVYHFSVPKRVIPTLQNTVAGNINFIFIAAKTVKSITAGPQLNQVTLDFILDAAGTVTRSTYGLYTGVILVDAEIY